jgi:carboxymethylenebutenolidase
MTYVDLSAQSAAAGGSPSLGGYLATPSGAGPFPAVLMIHEAFGLNDQIRAHADRLARAGYLTLAVDLFSDGGALRCLVSTMRSMMTGSGRVFTDLATARTWLATSPLSTGKTGVIGFCMGGGFALLLAMTGQYQASAPFYGMAPKQMPRSCPVVGSYGGKDLVLKSAPARLERNLTELGVPHDVKVYPEVGHSFYTKPANRVMELVGPYTPLRLGYHEPSAKDARERVVAFFRQHLDAQPADDPQS